MPDVPPRSSRAARPPGRRIPAVVDRQVLVDVGVPRPPEEVVEKKRKGSAKEKETKDKDKDKENKENKESKEKEQKKKGKKHKDKSNRNNLLHVLSITISFFRNFINHIFISFFKLI